MIFDLGAYDLDSTSKYLEQGHRVIAVEANPKLCRAIKEKFKSYARSRQLIIVNKAVTDKDDDIVKFYVQDNNDVWSSIYRKIAERDDPSEEITVPTITLKSLIKQYGCPDYCKIDIEGADVLAIQSLRGMTELPKFISAESECLGNDDVTDGLDVIKALYDVGYTKFFLDDQWHPHIKDPLTWPTNNHMDYDTFVEYVKVRRNTYVFEHNYSFWFDVHATI